jgi:hypothetical protein
MGMGIADLPERGGAAWLGTRRVARTSPSQFSAGRAREVLCDLDQPTAPVRKKGIGLSNITWNGAVERPGSSRPTVPANSQVSWRVWGYGLGAVTSCCSILVFVRNSALLPIFKAKFAPQRLDLGARRPFDLPKMARFWSKTARFWRGFDPVSLALSRDRPILRNLEDLRGFSCNEM